MLSNKWENFFLLVIILSIIQLFSEEFAVISNWMVSTRHTLIYLGFIFDLIFTIEFIIRLTISARKGKAVIYLKYERGWIDFLASIPLLLFYSGPMVYSIFRIANVASFSQLASFKTLKLLKIIRISRILRLLRILKVFGKISKTAAKMVKHHIATVTTTALGALILGLFIIQILFKLLNWPGIEIFGEERKLQYRSIINKATVLSAKFNITKNQALNILFVTENRILKLSNNDEIIIEKHDLKEMLANFDLDDLSYLELDDVSIWYHIKDINIQMANNNIEIFLLVIFILCGLIFLYSKHFIKYIALPLDALQQKITDPAYQPQLKPKKAYEEDEIFEIINILGKKDRSVGGY